MINNLAVKYRPANFGDVVSQQSIIKILEKQLELKEYSNVYLFAGPSGCGKTTLARIFANKINNSSGTPIEIDAASNNGVDNIREIIKSAKERSLDSEYKIYIMDECHMLTIQSWNALLKIIEEPPKYTIFMFATTDPQKIPNTIQNRVMRFNLSRISSLDIKNRLIHICKKEGFINYVDACDYISRISKNQMRDAISILEKCVNYCDNSLKKCVDLNLNNVEECLGIYSYDIFIDLVDSILDYNTNKVIKILNYIYNQGNDMILFIDQFLSFTLDVCKYCICKDIAVTKFPITIEDKIKSIINFDNPNKYYVYIIDSILNLKNMLKTDMNPKDTIEVNFIKLCGGN